jgi:DNA-binding CsgD family transcriptional regulator
VARCDLALIEVERDAQRLAPWFELASLPSAQHHRMTKRELDAAYLATAGLSNRAIAERLACGVRTVESHLASARAKLGASNRHDLAHRMRELGYA